MHGRGITIRPLKLPEHDFSIHRGEFAGDELDFEIRFFEGVLETNPDHADSLMFLGHVYTARGDYERGLAMDMRLVRLRPRDPIVHYNLACSYSLVGQVDDCFHALERSVRLGYAELDHIQADEDLVNARRDPRFERLLESIRAAQQQ